MRLLQDHLLGAANVDVPCLVCHGMLRIADAIIDADGPAFLAYYHVACAPAGPVSPCKIDGCKRLHFTEVTR